MSGAPGGAGGVGAGVWAEASAWVVALARATCWRKVRRLVDIRYRVLSGGDRWGGQGVGTPIWRKLAIYLTQVAGVGWIHVGGALAGALAGLPAGGRGVRRGPGGPPHLNCSIAQLLAIGPSALERSWMMRSRCFVAVETADSRAIQ